MMGIQCYVLVEVKEEEWVLGVNDSPLHHMLLWPRRAQEDTYYPQEDTYYFLLQEHNADGTYYTYYFLLQERKADRTIKYMHMQLVAQATAAWRLVERGLLPQQQGDFDKLCNLPQGQLLEETQAPLLQQKIYMYTRSILVTINPFKSLPIYHPQVGKDAGKTAAGQAGAVRLCADRCGLLRHAEEACKPVHSDLR
ncbi:Hypothetical predicted protein [Marmota monax]|uniref:Ras-associating domain-containing protein n=1 Tax=Marmota monax TaxID=9995 RepID=A0A5E4BTM9_MARMO|nr:hypothetical protein GHT09_016915 [Marmota monax]VTJ72924.1 Hypothetical predicted protein [Marmota monax]